MINVIADREPTICFIFLTYKMSPESKITIFCEKNLSNKYNNGIKKRGKSASTTEKMEVTCNKY